MVKDLVVDRSAFDRIIQAGGYISVNTGNAVDANATPIEKTHADAAFAAAACIGCGACVAACKNSSAMLFMSAKVAHLSLLPQGAPERKSRVSREKIPRVGYGCANGQRRIWLLHIYRSLRSGMPQGNIRYQYLQA